MANQTVFSFLLPPTAQGRRPQTPGAFRPPPRVFPFFPLPSNTGGFQVFRTVFRPGTCSGKKTVFSFLLPLFALKRRGLSGFLSVEICVQCTITGQLPTTSAQGSRPQTPGGFPFLPPRVFLFSPPSLLPRAVALRRRGLSVPPCLDGSLLPNAG